MKQILHIFLKDARRFWGEIGILLGITFGVVAIGAYVGARPDDLHSQILALLAGLLAILIPVGWWFLITRVVQAERLVGDTQFWITRPYVWTSLMSSKGLFLLAFLCFPFFVAQCVMLAGAGFAPFRYVPGLLFNLLLLTGFAILPLAAVATVTSSLARVALTLLGIFLVLIAVVTVLAFLFATRSSGMNGHTAELICLAVAIVGCLVAIVWQYQSRRVWIARLVLVAVPVVMLAANYVGARYDQAKMDKLYPAAQGGLPIQIAYTPDPKSWQTLSFQANSHATIPVMVRLEETGGAVGQAVLTDAVRAEISAPDGTRWQSDWENADNYKFLAGESRFSLGFSMAIADFRKFEGKPLAVHLVIALSQAQAGRTTTLGLPQGKFSIPEFVVCSPKTGWTPLPGQISGLDCVAPLRVSPLTFISTQWSDGPCTGGPAGPESGPVGQAWLGSLDRMPAEMNISPVVEQHLNLSNATANETEDGQSRPRFRSLCPGTPITFTEYNRVRRMQTALDIQGFYLPKLTEANGQFSVTE